MRRLRQFLVLIKKHTQKNNRQNVVEIKIWVSVKKSDVKKSEVISARCLLSSFSFCRCSDPPPRRASSSVRRAFCSLSEVSARRSETRQWRHNRLRRAINTYNSSRNENQFVLRSGSAIFREEKMRSTLSFSRLGKTGLEFFWKSLRKTREIPGKQASIWILGRSCSSYLQVRSIRARFLDFLRDLLLPVFSVAIQHTACHKHHTRRVTNTIHGVSHNKDITAAQASATAFFAAPAIRRYRTHDAHQVRLSRNAQTFEIVFIHCTSQRGIYKSQLQREGSGKLHVFF